MSQYFLKWNIHCAYYVDLTSFGIKKHVRLLLLRCFCILLLNWDIRVPPLCGFHIGHRKIKCNTRINRLFQLTTTRLRYHITFTIAVVIQATEKQFSWHKWLKNELSDYAHYAVLPHNSQNEISTTLFYFKTIKSKSLTTLTTLFYFSTIKRKSLTSITMLFHFTTTKMKYLTTLTTVFLLSLLLKWNLWLHSQRCFTFTTIKMKSLTMLTTLFYFHYY